MIRGFYSAKLGALAQQENLNLISNNIANVNTVGYKPMRTSFTDLMYQNLNRSTAENTAVVGHGVKINKTDLSMSMGALDGTNYNLDFAILEEGAFFAVRTMSGDIQYTRAGNLILSEDNGTFYLAAPNGDRILDADGEEIEVEFEQVEYNIPHETEDGELYYEGPFYHDGQPIINKDQIGVYRFRNPFGLYALGNNRFAATDVSGQAEAIEENSGDFLKAGYLEKSAVEISVEMVRTIEASKAFSFNSRMIQVADEIEQTVNSLR